MPDPIASLIPPLPQTLTPIDELRARVDALLAIFDDPRYAPLDIPDWVRRATAEPPTWVFDPPFTVRGLIRALRDSVAELSLANGERYVLDAICACADDAVSPSAQWPGNSTRGEALARGLQRLANAWTAFLLWPFFGQMEDPDNGATGIASPCIGLAFTPKAMAAGYVDPDADSRVSASSYPLREEILRRDGFKCIISGAWDMRYHGFCRRPDLGGRPAWTDAVRIFKHPLVVYKDIYDADEPKRKSTMLSLELLRRFSELSDRYIRDPIGSGVMDDPANMITLNVLGHSKFDHFGFCFVPTQTPNTYKVIDHDPTLVGMPEYSSPLPDTVTFEDHTSTRVSADVNGSPCIGPPHVALPDPELMRTHALLGSVLYKSGLVHVLVRLEYVQDRAGGLPWPTPDGLSFWNRVVGTGDSSEEMVDRLVRSFEAMYV